MGNAQRDAYVLAEAALLDVIARYAPIVEIGAGTGYWAHLLRERGVDVLAYDQAPAGGPRENRYHPGAAPWSEVLQGDASALAGHTDRALLMCWPPAFSELGDVLRHYAGDTVIYVGDNGPRTVRVVGLGADFTSVERHPVVAFDPAPGRPAELVVWRRKALTKLP